MHSGFVQALLELLYAARNIGPRGQHFVLVSNKSEAIDKNKRVNITFGYFMSEEKSEAC